MSKLSDFGYSEYHEKLRIELGLEVSQIGRIITEHKERYIVKTETGEFEAEITGNMRFSASGREDFPAVGDWVALTAYDSDFAIIHKIFPRTSVIKRQAIGQFGEVQIIATNVDYAFIVQAIDRDFNINRIERYLTICNSSNIQPIIIISKIDLIPADQLEVILDKIKARIKDIPVITISNETHDGITSIKQNINNGKTYCLLGSSGVGKSTLLNNLAGNSLMKTDSISASTNRGKHITTHRELIILENGGIIIDNPGMREVGIADGIDGLENTFSQIEKYSHRCKFKDCTHTHESGCGVIKALKDGEIDNGSYENYLKLKKEQDFFESTVEERRKKDKDFGKMLKNYKKDLKRNQ